MVRLVSGVERGRDESQRREEEAWELQLRGPHPYSQLPRVRPQPEGAECSCGSRAGDEYRALHDDGLAAAGSPVEVEFAAPASGRVKERQVKSCSLIRSGGILGAETKRGKRRTAGFCLLTFPF